MTITALTLYVYEASGPVSVSLLMLAISLPRLLGPLAGVVADRVDERPMLGRVFGVFYGGVMLAEALGAALGGLLLGFASPRAAFVFAGVATLAAVLVAWRLSRSNGRSNLRAPG